MRSLVLLSLFTLASASAAVPSKADKKLDAAKASAVQAYITNTLKDPESVRFRNVRVKWEAVCGEMNAKNGFGGYVGFRRFYAIDGTDLHMEPDRFDENQWDRFCGPNAKKPEQPAPYHEKWIE
ncbi:hypothetical protein [Massilia sp. BKSP1R2A-1]|uniref:hypothetical protein n=1 Tax=Massilia sp. BKSP1R2A-1 TaxID=3422595 RepID=UPI003D32F9DF